MLSCIDVVIILAAVVQVQVAVKSSGSKFVVNQRYSWRSAGERLELPSMSAMLGSPAALAGSTLSMKACDHLWMVIMIVWSYLFACICLYEFMCVCDWCVNACMYVSIRFENV